MYDSPWIHATTDATFERDVIEASRERPVVVDFWAAWCQPCLMLKPLLEKLAAEYAGRFLLVKAETDHNPQAAGAFNVSSIPAVFGVVQGEVVDFFGGLIPESQLRAWLDRLLAAQEIVATRALEASDPAAAEAAYRRLLAAQPKEPALQIGLARTLLALQRREEAAGIVATLEARGFLEPEAQKLKSTLALGAGHAGDVTALRSAAASAAHDAQVQLDLAIALASQADYEAALQQALAVIALTKTGPGEQARKLMVDIFRALPEDSELTGVYRRKLASALY